MPQHLRRSIRFSLLAPVVLALACATAVFAQTAYEAEKQLVDAAEVIGAFTDQGPESIPTELLERARAIAVIPKVFRGGFILGARRGRGVLSVRLPDGSWSNPAFVKLTGGSVGWQVGAESTDLVLVFANDAAVKNLTTGKFTLGGEASAVAGPLRKQAASNVTFRAEVYGYLRSRGLYAGAAFQGARLDIDEELGSALYGASAGTQAFAASTSGTPLAASHFLDALTAGTGATSSQAAPPDNAVVPEEESEAGATTFALPD